MIIECPDRKPDGTPCDWKTPDLGDDHVDHTMRLLDDHIKAWHPRNPGAVPAKQEKAKAPQLCMVNDQVTEVTLGIFRQQLTVYKRLAGLSASTSSDTILQCLPAGAYRELWNKFGAELPSRTEAQILKDIEDILVRPENRLAHVLKLLRMKQDPGQTVPIFAASLRAAARLGKFKVCCASCETDVSYEDDMVLYTFLAGLENSDVQADLLAKPQITLADAEAYARDKEMAKRSQEAMASAAAEELNRLSAYKQEKKKPAETQRAAPAATAPVALASPASKCGYCGESAHTASRKKECKAYNTTCACGLKGHLTTMCRNKGKPRERRPELNAVQSQAADDTGTLFEIVERGKGYVSGIVFNRSARRWTEKTCTSAERKLGVTITLDQESLSIFSPGSTVKTSAVARTESTADTGASVVCAGPSLLQQMSIPRSALLPTKMRLYAANRQSLTVLGCFPGDIAIPDIPGKTTKEMIYVVKELQSVFLSRHALVGLGCIPESFPRPAESEDVAAAEETKPGSAAAAEICGVAEGGRAPCGCLLRSETPAPPVTDIPMTEENIPRLRQLLTEHYASSTFNTCHHQKLPLMKGSPPLEIHLRPDAVPKQVHTPATIPVHFREAVKRDLDRDVAMGVIEKVGVNDSFEWCSRMVITRKHNGEPRRTVDLQALNAATLRQTHHTQPAYQQASTVPKDHWKTVTDAWKGYASLPLRESDRPLTTFITPWGRYRDMSATQGSCIAGDGYTHRFDNVTAGVENVKRVIDDSILYKPTISEMFTHTANYLTLCGRHGILQHPDKFVFCQKEVDWAGFRLGVDDVRPLAKHTQAVRDFPVPENVTDLRSFMQLVNQVSHFYAAQPKLHPFRELLKKDTPWYWDERLDDLFSQVKEVIADKIESGVKTFDLSRPVALLTDWSKSGVGYVLTQKYCGCPGPTTPLCCSEGWKVCGVGARFTSAAESRYSPTEGEALAVANALHKTRYFTLGCPDLVIGVDHKPLLGIFNDKPLDAIDNRRLRNLKEHTLGWRFRMVYIPGKQHGGPDALSRYGVRPPDTAASRPTTFGSIEPEMVQELEDLTNPASFWHWRDPRRCRDCWDGVNEILALASDEQDDDVAIIMAIAEELMPVDHRTIQQTSAKDPSTQKLLKMLSGEGFPPSASEMSPELRQFWQVRNDLHPSTTGDMVMYKGRPVIPTLLRDRVISTLHSAHQGTTGMKLRAERSCFWPGITADIDQARADCSSCHKHSPSNPSEPPVPPVVPEYPFQHVCADYFHYGGHSFGVVVDRFSNWFQVYESAAGAKTLVAVARELCRDFGVPETLTSDGGPEFKAGEFQDFLKQHGIQHRLSSVAFPHANCRAELAVKTAKRLIRENVSADGKLNHTRLTRALLTYRNTPDRATDRSPAELLLGRQLRDFLPGSQPSPPLRNSSNLSQTWQDVARWREMALSSRSTKAQERLSEHARDLPELDIGTHVLVQNQNGNNPRLWDKRGVIVEVLPFRQYRVMIDGSRRITLRNRKFLRAFTPVHSKQSLLATPQLQRSAPAHAEAPPKKPTQAGSRAAASPARVVPAPSYVAPATPPIDDLAQPQQLPQHVLQPAPKRDLPATAPALLAPATPPQEAATPALLAPATPPQGAALATQPQGVAPATPLQGVAAPALPAPATAPQGAAARLPAAAPAANEPRRSTREGRYQGRYQR